MATQSKTLKLKAGGVFSTDGTHHIIRIEKLIGVSPEIWREVDEIFGQEMEHLPWTGSDDSGWTSVVIEKDREAYEKARQEIQELLGVGAPPADAFKRG